MKVFKQAGQFSIAFIVLLLLAPAAWAQSFSLGTTNLLEGPAAGSDNVVLAVSPANSPWTATTNATWLHLTADNQSGTGSTNVIFSFDANSGATRIGTLTIAGQTLTITQAGSTYVATTNVTTLVSSNAITPLNGPSGVAVDSAGNVYIADILNNAIKEWIAVSNSVITLVSAPANPRWGLAIDGADNVYFSAFPSSIKKWIAASNSVITLSSFSIPSDARGVAVDGAGNVYFADSNNNMILEWIAASNTVNSLAIFGLNHPIGVALDVAGNIYISDFNNNAVKKWTAANGNVTTLVHSNAATPLHFPNGVAVDGAGNIYITDSLNNAVKKWTAANNNVTTLVSAGLKYPADVAVDGAGNVYIADYTNNAVKELVYAFVDSTAKAEPAIGGSDTLPVVLPATANLTGPFVPASDSAWLTISGCNNGVVSFAFAANYFATNRTGHITVLGQSIAVTQPAIVKPVLSGCKIMGDGSLQFCFTNNQGASFTVWASTNMLLPFTNWTALGALTNDGSGQYQFNDLSMTNGGQRFYRVSSP